MVLFFFQFLFLSVGMSFISPLPEGPMKRWLHYQVYTVGFQIMGGVLSAVITYHNPENKPEGGGICVANHTSPIDVVILACDNAYALVSGTITELNVLAPIYVSIIIGVNVVFFVARLDNFILVSLEAFKEFCLVLPLTFGLNVQSRKTGN